MKENFGEKKNTTKVEVVVNNLENLSYKKYDPDKFVSDSVLEEVEKSSPDELHVASMLFKSKEEKDQWLENRRAEFNSMKVSKEKEKEIIKALSPLERIQKLRIDFLNQLEANNLKKFSADYFWADNQPVGVFANMFVVDKNQLNYKVNSVVKAEGNGEFQRSEGRGNVYEEKISLNENQLNNFISLIEKNIEETRKELKGETNNSIASSLSEWINRLEDTINILKNGGGPEDYDPRIGLSA